MNYILYDKSRILIHCKLYVFYEWKKETLYIILIYAFIYPFSSKFTNLLSCFFFSVNSCKFSTNLFLAFYVEFLMDSLMHILTSRTVFRDTNLQFLPSVSICLSFPKVWDVLMHFSNEINQYFIPDVHFNFFIPQSAIPLLFTFLTILRNTDASKWFIESIHFIADWKSPWVMAIRLNNSD